MKILLTGGHFAPALAIIEKLKGEQIVVVGRKTSHEGDTGESFEYRICKELGIPFRTIRAGRLQRVVTSKTLPSLLRLPVGFFDAYALLKKEKPDVVVVFGGYVALPIAVAAKMLSIPVVLHEQVQKAGVTARLVDRLASVVCISFESSRRYFKNKNIVLTGNPIREELLRGEKIEGLNDSFIYITGGSSGSHAINKAVLEILPSLLKDFVIVHQAGNSTVFNDLKTLQQFKDSLSSDLKNKYILRPFFNTKEAGWLYRNASIVISRAGINTITDLVALGSPALLIPLPYGQKNEQLENAKLFKEIGLGEYILQEKLNSKVFLSTIHAMIKNRKNYKKIENSKFKDPILASQLIVEQIQKYGRERENRKTTKAS